MLAEYTEQGQLIRQYDYFQESWSTDPIYQYSKAENADGTTAANYTYSFYHSDHLGTPQLLMESNGAVSWRAAYEAFGEAKELAIAQGAVTKENLLRFPGQYYDGETGTHYNFHRDYDSGLGRYLTGDPIGLGGGYNRFGYVGQSPLLYTDPTGEIIPLLLFNFAVGFALDVAIQMSSSNYRSGCLNLTKSFWSGVGSMFALGRLSYILNLKALHPFLKLRGYSKRQAYNKRSQIKRKFRVFKPVDDVLRKRDTKFGDIKDPLDSFSRTSNFYNNLAIGGGAVTVNRISDGCEC